MWRSVITKAASPFIKLETGLLLTENLRAQQQIRTTFILKRRADPFLSKKGYPRKKLRTRHYVYDLVKDSNIEKPRNIDLILTSFVSSLGNAGDKVSVQEFQAYDNLLVPGLAVYATPENLEKYKDFEVNKHEIVHYSSSTALKMIESLKNLHLGVIMNKDSPWTIQPWHIRTSFRKGGFIVPEEAITLPDKPIKGPDMNIEGKTFFVTVAINKTETVNVKCKIRHWSTNITDRLPYVPEFWLKPVEYIFPEDAQQNEKL